MEELINSILVIKMYCWESFSLQKVIESRKRFRTFQNKFSFVDKGVFKLSSS